MSEFGKTSTLINPRSVYMLHILKEQMLDDNDLALRACKMGSLVVARHIDAVVSGIMNLETELRKARICWDGERRTVEEYRKLLGDYDPDMVSDKRKAELHALLAQWEAQDKEGEE